MFGEPMEDFADVRGKPANEVHSPLFEVRLLGTGQCALTRVGGSHVSKTTSFGHILLVKSLFKICEGQNICRFRCPLSWGLQIGCSPMSLLVQDPVQLTIQTLLVSHVSRSTLLAAIRFAHVMATRCLCLVEVYSITSPSSHTNFQRISFTLLCCGGQVSGKSGQSITIGLQGSSRNRHHMAHFG